MRQTGKNLSAVFCSEKIDLHNKMYNKKFNCKFYVFYGKVRTDWL